MKAGYARCSTNESKQDIERQVRELKQAGAETVYLEYEHGDAAVKEQLSLLLEQAKAGDTIITLEVSPLPARPSSSVKSLKPSAGSSCVLSLSVVSQWTAEAGTQTQ